MATSQFLNLDTDGTLSANSDTVVPSQKAIKTYVDQHGGSVSIDNSSITKNSSNELQASGVIDSNDGTTTLKTYPCTRAEYQALVANNAVDADTFYNVQDDPQTSLSFANTDLSNLTQAGLDKFVKRTGDTMSGELSINKNYTHINIIDSLLDRNTAPGETATGGYIDLRDTNNNVVGRIFGVNYPEGAFATFIQAIPADGIAPHIGVYARKDGSHQFGYLSCGTPSNATGSQIVVASNITPKMSAGVAFASGTAIPVNALVVADGTVNNYGVSNLTVDGHSVMRIPNNEGSGRVQCMSCIVRAGSVVAFSFSSGASGRYYPMKA